ncbi:MAG: chloride channel protein [Elusimicrobia bacterium]|nr:chloride channel protein [Elusimicrobiota bacterium]
MIGVAIHGLYSRWGQKAEGGNDLVIERIHTPGAGVPRRMAPLILAGTLLTHLGGGSSGREGTALQMGGGISAFFARVFDLSAADRRTLLMAGGGGGVRRGFGTPVAGAVFALEVAVLGHLDYEPLVPCLWAAVVGHWVCLSWGTHHTNYHQQIAVAPVLAPALTAKVLAAAVAFGLASASSFVSHRARAACPVDGFPPLAPSRGRGRPLIALTALLGDPGLLGAGGGRAAGRPDTVTLLSAFRARAPPRGVGCGRPSSPRRPSARALKAVK